MNPRNILSAASAGLSHMARFFRAPFSFSLRIPSPPLSSVPSCRFRPHETPGESDTKRRTLTRYTPAPIPCERSLKFHRSRESGAIYISRSLSSRGVDAAASRVSTRARARCRAASRDSGCFLARRNAAVLIINRYYLCSSHRFGRALSTRDILASGAGPDPARTHTNRRGDDARTDFELPQERADSFRRIMKSFHGGPRKLSFWSCKLKDGDVINHYS